MRIQLIVLMEFVSIPLEATSATVHLNLSWILLVWDVLVGYILINHLLWTARSLHNSSALTQLLQAREHCTLNMKVISYQEHCTCISCIVGCGLHSVCRMVLYDAYHRIHQTWWCIPSGSSMREYYTEVILILFLTE